MTEKVCTPKARGRQMRPPAPGLATVRAQGQFASAAWNPAAGRGLLMT